MGVHGLTSYIRKSTSLGTFVSLPPPPPTEPIPFIVDGLAFIYHVGLVDPLRGGNYAYIRASVRRHIQYWRACGLEPEFVWDGPFHSDKLPTVIQRSQQSLARSIAYMKASDIQRSTPALRNNASRLPALTHMAVSAELEALGVESHVAEEEADSPTAELAQRKNGYVVSNDSDYFIYPSRCRGYVPLASVEYGLYNVPRLENVSPNEPPHLRLRVFRHEEVAHALSLPPSLLAIFAALVGNDLADYAAEICLPRPANARPLFPGQMEPTEVRRIAGAVARCAGMPALTHPQLQDIIFAVLPSLLQRPSADPYIVANLARSAFGYTLRPLETPSPSFPLHPQPNDTHFAVVSRALYKTAYQRSHLSSFHVHVLKHGTVVVQGSVEQPEFASPMVVLARPLRIWVYAALQDALGGRLPHGPQVIEYVRRGEELFAAVVDVPLLGNLIASAGADPSLFLFSSSHPSPSPFLHSPISSRRALFLLVFGYSPSSVPPPSSPLHPFLPLILALRHMSRFAKRPWTPHENLSALVVAVLLRLAPSSLPSFSSSGQLPVVPPKPLIQRSVELVQTLVAVNLFAQSLLLCQGQIDAQGEVGTLHPPHEVFDGAGLHAMMQLGMGVEKVVRDAPPVVGQTVRELQGFLLLE
ncbi:hypothetical protein JCM8547_007187 [Rhodosporidiobolus lusitaniae]